MWLDSSRSRCRPHKCVIRHYSSLDPARRYSICFVYVVPRPLGFSLARQTHRVFGKWQPNAIDDDRDFTGHHGLGVLHGCDRSAQRNSLG